jgi:hypothetical protein
MKIVIMIQLDGINKMILNQILIEHLLTKTLIQILKMVSLNFFMRQINIHYLEMNA